MKTTRVEPTFVRLHAKEALRRKQNIRLAAVIFLPLVLCWIWYCVAADYSYKAVAGSYTLRMKNESSILVLRRDGSFQQELVDAGNVKHSQGTWRRLGEGGVVFSNEFLRISGVEVGQSGETYGEVQKTLGLFLSISFNQSSGEPLFHKRLFS